MYQTKMYRKLEADMLRKRTQKMVQKCTVLITGQQGVWITQKGVVKYFMRTLCDAHNSVMLEMLKNNLQKDLYF